MDFKLKIYRDGEEHLLVDIDLNTIFSHIIMGEHLVRSTFTTPHIVDVREGDYIVKGIEQFTINAVDVPVSKDNGKTFTYNIEFEGYIYDLRDQAFTHLDALEFSLYIKPIGLVQNVVDCMNMISSGWTVGVVDDLPEQNIEFYADGKGYTCKEAMIKGADAWKLEFWLVGKQLNFTKQAGVDTTLVFEHGRGKGLYEIERGKLDQEYFNRLYINGGTKNIPYTYRNGFKRLRLEEPYLELPLTAGKKRRVGSVVLDDIFPRRTGTITGVSDDFLELEDTSIDFDLEGQRIAGDSAVIKFTSGVNSGRSFEIEKYTHSTKKLVIKPLVEADGYTFPNVIYEIQAGDKYVFLGIVMPNSYVTASETELRTEGFKILNKAANSKLPYLVFLDQKFLRDNGVVVNIGDRVRIKDSDLAIDDMIRTSAIRYPWVNPDLLDLTISDNVILHVADKADIDIKKNQRRVVTTTKISAEDARKNALLFSKLQNRLFDPDGNLAEGALTLLAAMLKIGFDSQNFGLVGVGITTNIGGDANKLAISAGKLVHYVYKIDGLGYEWNMSAASWSGLNPSKFYYVYAKCSKTSLVGTWQISETPVYTNDIDGYWCFNLGQLFEVNADNYRDFDFTKGVTWIVGNQITTGRIQDISKQNFLDLETGQLNLGNSTRGIDWDVTNPGFLTIRGGLIQNAGGITAPLGVYRGQYYYLTTYYTGDTVSYGGSVWRLIYPVPIFNVTPVEGIYWTLEVSKGTDGRYTEMRFAKNGSSTAAPSLTTTDPIPSGWSTSQPSISAGEFVWATSALKNADGTLAGVWSAPARYTGVNGIDGKYTELRFAKNGSTSVAPSLTTTDPAPSGWSTVQPSTVVGEYIWTISAIKLSDGTLVGVWSTPVRYTGVNGANGTNGSNGTNGADGPIGPSLIGRGNYDPVKTYVGSTERIEVVNYGGLWYRTRIDAGSFSGVLPTNAAKWNAFSGQFESVATDILFASLAYIDNLGVRYLSTGETGARWEINEGGDNSMKMYNASNVKKIQIDDNSAVIGWSIVGGVPAPIYGAGITIGSLSANYSSISETSISTSGDVFAAGYGVFGENCKARSLGSEVGSGSGALGARGLILANGSCSLDDYPEDGQIQAVKNTTSGNITLSPKSGSTSTKLYDLANGLNSSMTMATGSVWTFQYYKTGDIWVQIGFAH